MEDLCRVCLSPGSHRLFVPQSSGSGIRSSATLPTAPLNTGCGGGVASALASQTPSLERLLEKLRYVSMIQINERTNEPKMLCDLCCMQLNVSYNFKRLANRSEADIHQYLIELGLPSVASKPTAQMADVAPVAVEAEHRTQPTHPVEVSVVNPMHRLSRGNNDVDDNASISPMFIKEEIVDEDASPFILTIGTTSGSDAATPTTSTSLSTISTDQRRHLQTQLLPSNGMVNIPSPTPTSSFHRNGRCTSDFDFIRSYLTPSDVTTTQSVQMGAPGPRHSTGFIVAHSKRRAAAAADEQPASTGSNAPAAPPRRRSMSEMPARKKKRKCTEVQRLMMDRGETKLAARLRGIPAENTSTTTTSASTS